MNRSVERPVVFATRERSSGIAANTLPGQPRTKLYTQARIYADLGLRQRILTLPLMMAFVLSLIWRQIGSVSEAVRELNRRGLLWSGPTKVSQQAVSQRLGSFPAEK